MRSVVLRKDEWKIRVKVVLSLSVLCEREVVLWFELTLLFDSEDEWLIDEFHCGRLF